MAKGEVKDATRKMRRGGNGRRDRTRGKDKGE